jgi:hypothetical protein
MPELIPTNMCISGYSSTNMKHMRTILDRKLLRSGFGREYVPDSGTLGG